MGFGGVAVAQPVLLGDGYVQLGGAEIDERNIKAAPIEGDHVVVVLGDIPEGGEQFDLIGAGNEFHGAAFAGVILIIFGHKEGLAAQGFGIQHGNAHHLGGEGPQAHELGKLLALGLAGDGILKFVGVAEKVLLLGLVEEIDGESGRFNIKYKRGHEICLVLKETGALGNQIMGRDIKSWALPRSAKGAYAGWACDSEFIIELILGRSKMAGLNRPLARVVHAADPGPP